MRNIIVLLLLLSPLAATDAAAQLGKLTILCAECRDPQKYPEDWANFAFNQVYGPNGWLDFDKADDFYIVNLKGDRVYADIDFVMAGVRIFGLVLPLWPKNMVLVTLALPNGQVIQFLRSVFVHSLPVPAPSGTQSKSGVQQIQPDFVWPQNLTPIEFDYPDSDRQ